LKTVRDHALGVIKAESGNWGERISAGWLPANASANEKEALLSLVGLYLTIVSPNPNGNPVAKFHLTNGAKLQQINWASDLSRKGLRQSAGVMVNYLYDLSTVEENHERFVNGEVIYARSVARLIAP